MRLNTLGLVFGSAFAYVASYKWPQTPSLLRRV